MTLRVLFVHGLESSSQGTKARYLAEHFDSVAPDMETSDFERSIATIAAAIQARRPDVLVGSSFGGAVALALLQRGVFSGPTLLLAPASRAYGLEPQLPAGVRVVIAHGTRDALVDPEDSRRLAASGSTDGVELVMVDDEHRLQSLVDTGRLSELVRRAAEPGP